MKNKRVKMMIKIHNSLNNRMGIENYHWQWFKRNCLKNWIRKAIRDEEFRKLFFTTKKQFDEWYNKKKSENLEVWLANQEEKKIEIFKQFIIGDIFRLKNKLGVKTSKSYKKYFENQYKIFRSSKTGWNGARLIKLLGVTVCPYCNRAFIDTYKVADELESNGELDHFFPKEKYPYLSLSLYNLIPCCSVCNKAKSNSYENILYPYDLKDGSYGEDAKFRAFFYTISDKESLEDDDKTTENRKYDVEYLLGNSNSFKIKLVVKDKKSIKGRKIENSRKVFKIDKLYNFHKDYVRSLIKKSIVYNESRIEELYSQYKTLFDSRDEVIKMIVGNNINEDDLDKRPLSKLTKDICEDLGLK